MLAEWKNVPINPPVHPVVLNVTKGHLRQELLRGAIPNPIGASLKKSSVNSLCI